MKQPRLHNLPCEIRFAYFTGLILNFNLNLNLILIFNLILILNIPLFGQYLMDWQVSQHYYEIGVPYFDINEDGTPELTKYPGNTVTVFDGTQNWSIVWSITAAGYDELVLWDVYSVSGERKALCLAATLLDQVSTTVQMYDLYGETPVWSTSAFEGYYSNVVITDLNSSEGDEILPGCTRGMNTQPGTVAGLSDKRNSVL